jgi:hypothetical protein
MSYLVPTPLPGLLKMPWEPRVFRKPKRSCRRVSIVDIPFGKKEGVLSVIAVEKVSVGEMMKTKRNENPQKPCHEYYQTSQWAFRSLLLKITLTSKGVLAIKLEGKDLLGQLYLWPDVEEVLPELRLINPFGAALADELSKIFTGQTIPITVPWVIKGPVWYEEFYHQLRKLPSGRVTEVSRGLPLKGGFRDENQLLTAIRQCRLAPLVPLHRIKLTGVKTFRFSLGKFWKEYLLRQENNQPLIRA